MDRCTDQFHLYVLLRQVGDPELQTPRELLWVDLPDRKLVQPSAGAQVSGRGAVMNNLGFQPKSQTLRVMLAEGLQRMEPNEQVIVHHVTDTPRGVQFEVERRSQHYGIRFERVKMP